MVNQDINIKTGVVASRVKSSHGDQTNKQQQQQLQPSAGTKDDKKVSERTCRRKRSFNNRGCDVNNSGDIFFQITTRVLLK